MSCLENLFMLIECGADSAGIRRQFKISQHFGAKKINNSKMASMWGRLPSVGEFKASMKIIRPIFERGGNCKSQFNKGKL